MNYLPHILGYIGVFCLVLSFQFNSKKKIMTMQAIGRLFFIGQYVFLSAYEGAAQSAVCMVCALFFMNRDCLEPKNRKWIVLMNLVVIVFGVIWWKNWLGLFVMAGAVLQNFAFAMKRPKVVRILTAVCIPFWFIYNFASGSYASMTSDCLTFLSVAAGIVRFDILKRPEKAQAQEERGYETKG